ncbi:MAG: glycosyltransferase family 2 protein [Nibricoccus sp.]
METVPVISVLLVAYNAGPFLRPALESLWNQGFKDFEVVLVDNASTDSSVADLPPEPRLRVITLPRNVYQSGGWRAGVRECRGEFIALMDADDLALPQRLENQLAFLRAHGDFVAVGARARTIDERDSTGAEYFVLTKERDIRDYAEFACPILPGALLIRREAMIAAELPIKWPQSADYDLVLRLLELGRVGCVDEVLYHYRQHSGSITSRRYLEQVALNCLVRLVAARRRAGKDERASEVEAEFSNWDDAVFSEKRLYADFTRRYLNEGFIRPAILVARRALFRGHLPAAFSLMRCVMRRSEAAEFWFRWRLALLGPLRVLEIRR